MLRGSHRVKLIRHEGPETLLPDNHLIESVLHGHGCFLCLLNAMCDVCVYFLILQLYLHIFCAFYLEILLIMVSYMDVEIDSDVLLGPRRTGSF